METGSSPGLSDVDPSAFPVTVSSVDANDLTGVTPPLKGHLHQGLQVGKVVLCL